MFALSILSVGLAMDAFAAALSQGASCRPQTRDAVRIASAFGLAQALMPLIGWSLGLLFVAVFRHIDHWIALALLLFIGGAMLREGLARSDEESGAARLTGMALFGAAIATSIDAAAAGITLPTLGQPLLIACGVIGATTALLSFVGVRLGSLAGSRAGKRAEVFGGVLLIALGIRIFVEHQFFGA